MADIWSEIIKVGIPAVASLAGGYLSGVGGQEASEEEARAAEEARRLTERIYYDQRGLAGPGYLMGGDAANLLGAQFGIKPQDYTRAYNGLNMGPIGGSGGGYLPNLGAGQPVAGHSGGGTNGLASGLGNAAGTAIGSIFGGPIGGTIGGFLGSAAGGMFRQSGPKGDNWTTLATQAPAGFDYATYMQQPDLQAEWAKPDVQALFGGNPDAYANWHFNKFGKGEGRTLNPATGGNLTPQPVGGVQSADGGAGTNGLSNPMGAFMDSPYGKIATEGFRGVDVPGVNSAFARGGKVLSGAQSIALDERGKARLGGAYTDYTNGLRSLAGMAPTASAQISGAAQNYGTNAGNLILNAGQARGEGLKSGYNGLTQGVSGAVSGVMDYGKNNWGWKF